MPSIDIIVPKSAPRRWQEVVIGRLQADGYDIAVLQGPPSAAWPAAVNTALALERKIFRRRGPALAAPLSEIPTGIRSNPAALRLDLAGNAAPSDIPTIALRFDGSRSDLSVPRSVAVGRLPVIEAVLDGKTVIGRAWPMIEKRESVTLGVEDVFARAITLAVSTVRAFVEGRLSMNEPVSIAPENPVSGMLGLASSYATSALPRLGQEGLRRARFRHAHWRVGYRFTDGPGVASACELGRGWSVLPDTGDRFYADPFPFQWRGHSFLFVEDYPHATGKAVISVVPFDAAGVPGKPRCVLEEPYHLSYPQVFERDGAIWMLPEASSGGKLVLYRATEFPDRWAPEAVLVEGEISDATLLDHGGQLWLFATDRDGYGSTSDTLVVFHASRLAGPWKPHVLNPVLIDRRMARPGGAFVREGGGIYLPVQDGTLGYGGGLGISQLLELDEKTVRLSPPRPIAAHGDWPYPKIHTLNRSGRLEVIDGIAAVRK
ncbi:glucosamine inositolphosphorylceramide transferase family protein [Rhizobium sp. LEGMi135b]